jgi:glucose/mannose transport system substrate-binding protein
MRAEEQPESVIVWFVKEEKMSVKFGLLSSVLAAALMAGTPAVAQNTAEVIHWWTSGGEAQALKVLVDSYEKTGNAWKDNPVAGGESARMTARTRILGGDPPTSMQWQLGAPLRALAEEGQLNDIDAVATAGNWDAVLPKVISDNAKFQGKYVAAPMDIHGHNWLWGNQTVLDDIGIPMPKSWAELIASADKIRAKGYIPLALGGQSWQEIFVFESILLDVGDRDFLTKVTYDLDDGALRSPTMLKAFETFAKVRDLVDPGSPSRDWNITGGLLTGGKAAYMIMGDWLKGEFAAAGKKPGKDIACEVFPAGKGTLVFGTDAFAMTAVKDAGAREAQLALAQTIMDPEVQKAFSLVKGSIPPRLGIDRGGFDPCAQIAMDEAAAGHLFLVPDNVADATSIGALVDQMTTFLHSDMTPEEGMKSMADAVAATR